MAFTQATAPTGLRNSELLSADNAIPERHIVIETVRNAACRLGLSAPMIATLDAMLSCLPPKRNHHTVFASNNTLTFRRNGISDRTIRRHAAALQEVGLIERRDSPNRKRYTKHSTREGKAMRFGFDLSPLFDRLQVIASIAADVQQEREQIDYLRTKIRAAANARLMENPDDEEALIIIRLLRRKLSLNDCKEILTDLPTKHLNLESAEDTCNESTEVMAANDGQSVRHHHKSNKELIEKEGTEQEDDVPCMKTNATITVSELLTTCSAAATFSPTKIENADDVIAHARTLAPMIGITSHSYEAAQSSLGALRTAATVWAIMQFHDKINAVGAYFHAITIGSKSDGFSPERLISRLATDQKYAT